jgi:hypothetical protein
MFLISIHYNNKFLQPTHLVQSSQPPHNDSHFESKTLYNLVMSQVR